MNQRFGTAHKPALTVVGCWSPTLAAARHYLQQERHCGDSQELDAQKHWPFSTRGMLLMLQFTDLQGLIYRVGNRCENTVKALELGRYLDHSTHVHHSYERKKK